MGNGQQDPMIFELYDRQIEQGLHKNDEMGTRNLKEEENKLVDHANISVTLTLAKGKNLVVGKTRGNVKALRAVERVPANQ